METRSKVETKKPEPAVNMEEILKRLMDQMNQNKAEICQKMEKQEQQLLEQGKQCEKLVLENKEEICQKLADQTNETKNHLENFKSEIKTQIRSRSLTHLDQLDPNALKYSSNNGTTEQEMLKDFRSEPDCTISDGASPPSAELTVPETVHSYLTDRDETTWPCSREHSPLETVSAQEIDQSASNRRHMMTRSQVSSSEYFSVVFDVNDDSIYPQEEFIPATKGVSLEDALTPTCKLRGINIHNCGVYLSNSRTPLYIQRFDSAYFAGKQLRVISKDASNKKKLSSQSSCSRKPPASYRSKSKFFSSSTEDANISPNTSETAEQFKKKERQRWSGFFNNAKDTKMEALVDQLNRYSTHGIPRAFVFDDEGESTDDLFYHERDWRELVNVSQITERQQQQQTALWELITTEIDYIRMLKVVKNLFIACLQSLQASSILIEIDKTKLFSNISEIYEANLLFWKTHIYPMLKHTRETHSFLNPELLLPGFIKFRDIFEPYIKYCSDQSKCQNYCKEMHSQNELFTAYLVWCETQKECNRLRLMDILVRPMQRLTKYGLLLKAIYKNSELESHKDCLSTMIKSVDDFVNNVNSILKCTEDSESLKRLISRIESYDAVESKEEDLERILKAHNNLDLSRPMLGCSSDRRRHLLLEDDFKLKDNLNSKLEIHCILLTDLLLIGKLTTKKNAQTVRIIRQPYIVDRLKVTEITRDSTTMGLVYLNEFDIAVSAFTLQSDAKKIKTWIDQIRKAQVLYRRAKLASSPMVRQQSITDASEQKDSNLEMSLDDSQSLFGVPVLSKSPLANSSHASRISSLAHSHSGSMEMNDQSSIGSINQSSRGVSIDANPRTASVSSDEGVQPLNIDKTRSTKSSVKSKLHTGTSSMKISTPNTLSVQPYTNLGQSLPNLVLGSPNSSTMNSTCPNLHTLSVPSTRPNQHLLSPSNRGISYPPPSPTRGNLRRGFAIQQNKNPPLLKTRHFNSTIGTSTQNLGPTNELDVPIISAISTVTETSNPLNEEQKSTVLVKRQNNHRSDNRRYHTAGVVDDIKKTTDNSNLNVQKRLSWDSDQTHTKAEDHNV